MESRESSYSEKLGLGARLCVAVRKLVRNFHSGCKFSLAAFSRENSAGELVGGGWSPARGEVVLSWRASPAEPWSPLPAAVLYFLLQVSFLVDEGVSPVLLQLLSCALCGSKVLAALAASAGSSSASSSAPVAASSGQATTQSKSSTKKSKKEEKEKEKEGKRHPVVLVTRLVCHSLSWSTGLFFSEAVVILIYRGPKIQVPSSFYFWSHFQLQRK